MAALPAAMGALAGLVLKRSSGLAGRAGGDAE